MGPNLPWPYSVLIQSTLFHNTLYKPDPSTSKDCCEGHQRESTPLSWPLEPLTGCNLSTALYGCSLSWRLSSLVLSPLERSVFHGMGYHLH